MSFLSYLINGISLGSVYAIIALGYTMVYGIARMLNFAHGDIIMVGGFTVFTIVTTMGGSAGCGYSGFGGCVYSAGRYDRASCIQTVA